MSFAPEGFEPDDIESGPGKSGYMTRKDLRVIAVGLLLILLAMTPIYIGCKRQAELHLCTSNFGAISKAINQYAASWDDRFPPAYAIESGEIPLVDRKGRPSTWATLITQYMNRRSSFQCPSAQESELVIAQHWSEGKTDVPMSYGMYAPFGGFQTTQVYLPERSALISETSNQGARETFDPHPFSAGGQQRPDGFLIAWDNGNLTFDKSTEFVTRLSFYGTASGSFKKLGAARHDGGINMLFCDGHVELIGPEEARVKHLGPDLTGMWSNGYK